MSLLRSAFTVVVLCAAGSAAASASPPAPTPDPLAERSLTLGELAGPAGAALGCTVLGGPCAAGVGSSLVVLGFGVGALYTIPCLGIAVYIVALLYALTVGVVPALFVGPAGALGAVLGAGGGAWLGDADPVPALVGALPGLVWGLCTAAVAGAAVGVWAWQNQANGREPFTVDEHPATYVPLIVVGVAGALGLLAGPLSVAGTGAAQLLQARPQEPPEGAEGLRGPSPAPVSRAPARPVSRPLMRF